MKKIIKVFTFILLISFYSSSFAEIEDNQVINALSGATSSGKILDYDFKLKKFKSCDDMSNVLSEYMKKVYKERPIYRGNMLFDKGMAMTNEMEATADGVSEESAKQEVGGGSDDYSKTNTQVLGVDESEIVKTDGKYIYYVVDTYDREEKKQVKKVFIVKNNSGKMEVVKKINLPKHLNSIELYIQDGKLVILANGYPEGNFQRTYRPNVYDTKTYVIVFDTKDIKNSKLVKLHMFEGNYTKSRLIGNNLYVIGNKYLDFYGMYYRGAKDLENIKVKPSDVISNELNVDYTTDKNKQNLELKGKKYPYFVSAGESVKCEDIEYLLPDDDTIKKYSFNPSFNIISVVNLKDLDKKVKNKVVFGDLREIHMSLDSLYMTSYLYTNYDFRCSRGFMCPMGWYHRGENTLIHKFDILDNADLSYKNTAIVNGNPLNQYSMDEYNSNFRIITSSWYPDRATNLFILDKDLKLVSSLTGLAKDENFQSSRFMGDKLYLVTFEQIDPFFVIDLKNIKNPKVLGELKIPGYSTYLHPYDENHIIGLGYDTFENKHGGTQNSGIKLDLYQINYDKTCDSKNLTGEEIKGCEDGKYKGIIVKQLYTKTLGTVRSNSEALHNPRMFIWNKDKKLLLLPANTYEKFDEEEYRSYGFFSGMYALKIDKNTGIKELFKVSHIDESKFEEDRKKACEKYLDRNNEEEKCKILIDGTKYCPPKKSYVPEYCYADSTISDYVSRNSYKYRDFFVKRALYIGDKIFSISNKQIKSNDMNNFSSVGNVDLK